MFYKDTFYVLSGVYEVYATGQITAHASHHIYGDGAGKGFDCGVDSGVKFCAVIMASGTYFLWSIGDFSVILMINYVFICDTKRQKYRLVWQTKMLSEKDS
jgi:hypothetical protein